MCNEKCVNTSIPAKSTHAKLFITSLFLYSIIYTILPGGSIIITHKVSLECAFYDIYNIDTNR